MKITNTLWGTAEDPGFFRSKNIWGTAALITGIALAVLAAFVLSGLFTAQVSFVIGTSSLCVLAGFSVLLAIVLFASKSGKKPIIPPELKEVESPLSAEPLLHVVSPITNQQQIEKPQNKEIVDREKIPQATPIATPVPETPQIGDQNKAKIPVTPTQNSVTLPIEQPVIKKETTPQATPIATPVPETPQIGDQNKAKTPAVETDPPKTKEPTKSKLDKAPSQGKGKPKETPDPTRNTGNTQEGTRMGEEVTMPTAYSHVSFSGDISLDE